MDIKELQSKGAFAPAEIVEKEVTFYNGEEDITFTAHIRPLSYKTAAAEIASATQSQEALAARIASTVCDKDSSPVFSVGDITGEADPERGPLTSELTMALLTAIGEVSGLGKSRGR